MAAGEGAKVPAVRRPEPRKHLHGVEVETSGDKWRQVEAGGSSYYTPLLIITPRSVQCKEARQLGGQINRL